MRLRIDTPWRTSHVCATAVLSKTQRVYFECERESRTPGSEITFPDDSFSDQNPPSSLYLANSRWTMRSLKTVAAIGVTCSLAERIYSFFGGTARTRDLLPGSSPAGRAQLWVALHQQQGPHFERGSQSALVSLSSEHFHEDSAISPTPPNRASRAAPRPIARPCGTAQGSHALSGHSTW